MKNNKLFVLGVLALIFGLVLAAGCDTGDGNRDTPSPSYKPRKLGGATYVEAIAKLDEIINYCNNHPGTVNDAVLTNAVQLKAGMSAYQSTWSSSSGTAIDSINNLISTIQGDEEPYLIVSNLSHSGEALIATTPLSQTSNYDTLLSSSDIKWMGTSRETFYPIWGSTSFPGTFNILIRVSWFQGAAGHPSGGYQITEIKYQNNVSFNINQSTTIDWNTMTVLEN
jgi:hypothetical protein